uniref:Sec-independent protein translocase protein TatA n=1 Tax=Candidatus Kentrum sp. TUN TaxID=2126343 RepID=A0A450ZSX8_9GAMM|nr:MAG: sec-independent protein translocase protein TatA [Candidatus Kentron sp. TUN]VFK53378.1 MAG: sec-independent protein translocase protein TatA [Candidatus Kentron sp. TUN]VFK56878.1 MAG: sec-independent protein translocase protein TatA [Candidatus Kentron sp. TUN]
MGFGGISVWQLLIILVIIVLLFGTKKLRNIGSDLGDAIKSFRSSIKDGHRTDETEDVEKSETKGVEKLEEDLGNTINDSVKGGIGETANSKKQTSV